MAALWNMDIIIDGKHKVVYMHPGTALARPYNHNRAGAAFIPDEYKSKNYIAWVIEGGPAYLSGIRDGDVLLKIDGVGLDKAENVNRQFLGPAGKKIDLTLKRGDYTFTTTVELKDILQPAMHLPEPTK
jgi:C-terminal processing protease CtpA/Prc